MSSTWIEASTHVAGLRLVPLLDFDRLVAIPDDDWLWRHLVIAHRTSLGLVPKLNVSDFLRWDKDTLAGVAGLPFTFVRHVPDFLNIDIALGRIGRSE